MSHLKYFNKQIELQNIFYESHCELITQLCIELDCADRIKEFQHKFLDKIKLKPKKDPNEPRKPKTSYMYFCEDKRQSVLDKYPNMLLGEQSKKLGDEWSKLEEENRKVYVDKAKKDKTRYEEEIDVYRNIWDN